MHPILVPSGRWVVPSFAIQSSLLKLILSLCFSSPIYPDNPSFWNDLEEGTTPFVDVEIET